MPDLSEILSEDNPPVMASSTSEVETVRGDKLPTIGQLQVPLSFNGRKFTCQFHVIENMTYNAVLGRDFLLSNGAVINFASGTVSLDKVKPIELTLKPIDLRPLVSLSVRNSHPTNRNHDETAIPFLIKLIPYDHFGQQLKKAAIFFLKFLIILLLMSPHGHVTTARDYYNCKRCRSLNFTSRICAQPLPITQHPHQSTL